MRRTWLARSAVVLLLIYQCSALAADNESSKPKSNTPRRIAGITDLEPDDRMALHLLASRFSPDEIGFVGTAVMNSARKQKLVQKLMGQLGLSSVPVFQGTGGRSQDYPDIASSKAAREYTNEGKGILPPGELDQLNNAALAGDQLQQHIFQELSQRGDVEFVVLAPPTDLVAVLEAHPDLKKNIKHIHIMGGWVQAKDAAGNDVLRTTYNWNMAPEASRKLMSMKDIPMTLYSSHMIKPNFGGGSVNSANYPNVIEAINDAAVFLPSIGDGARAGTSWDSHLVEKIPPLKNVIGAYVGKQFTPADPLVIIGMVSPSFIKESRRVAVNIDTADLDAGKGFRVDLQPDSSSNIALVEKVDTSVFEHEMLQTFSQLPVKVNRDLRVTYFTDPEGSWEKFHGFLAANENFFLGADGKYHLKADAHFVFGGDAVDRGAGSLRILRELLRLKEEGGGRVTFIAGNRDANKIRLTSELSDQAMRKPLTNEGLREWLSQIVKTHGPVTDDALVAVNTKANRLKWILEMTMGAPKAFEFRRQELSELQGVPVSDVSNDAVVTSFLVEVSPNGEMTRFLESAKLAHRIGNTLFVHSGVPDQSVGHIPGRDANITDVNVWIHELNRWYQSEISAWKNSPSEQPTDVPRAGQKLIEYTRANGDGGSDNPESVVYGRNSDRFNNPRLPSNRVIDFLVQQGIRRVIFGHTPTGEVPVTLRRGNSFEVISADNSRALNELAAHQVNLKGNALDTVAIEFTPVGISGVNNKVSFSTRLGESTMIGQQLADGSIIVAPHSGDFLTFQWGPGFKGQYVIRSVEEIRRLGTGHAVMQFGVPAHCVEPLRDLGKGH